MIDTKKLFAVELYAKRVPPGTPQTWCLRDPTMTDMAQDDLRDGLQTCGNCVHYRWLSGACRWLMTESGEDPNDSCKTGKFRNTKDVIVPRVRNDYV